VNAVAANITDIFPDGRWEGNAEQPILYFCKPEGAPIVYELEALYRIGDRLYKLTDCQVSVDVEIEGDGYFNPTGLQTCRLAFERLPLGDAVENVNVLVRRMYDRIRGYR
jgi:hypothetical protein